MILNRLCSPLAPLVFACTMLFVGCGDAPKPPGETGAIQFTLSPQTHHTSIWAPFAAGAQSFINLSARGTQPRTLQLRSEAPEVATVDSTATLRQGLFSCLSVNGTTGCFIDASISLQALAVGQARIVVSENGYDLDAVTVDVEQAQSLQVRSDGRWRGNTYGSLTSSPGTPVQAIVGDRIEFAGVPLSASGAELVAQRPLTFRSTNSVLEGGGTDTFEAKHAGATQVVAEFLGLNGSVDVLVTDSSAR